METMYLLNNSGRCHPRESGDDKHGENKCPDLSRTYETMNVFPYREKRRQKNSRLFMCKLFCVCCISLLFCAWTITDNQKKLALILLDLHHQETLLPKDTKKRPHNAPLDLWLIEIARALPKGANLSSVDYTPSAFNLTGTLLSYQDTEHFIAGLEHMQKIERVVITALTPQPLGLDFTIHLTVSAWNT